MPRFPPLDFVLALALALAPLPAAPQQPAPGKPPDKERKEQVPEDVQAIVRREVEKAKAEMRDEIRAELQGQQSAKEFIDAAGPPERPKLDLLQLSGYLRVRGDLFQNLPLRRSPDPGGYTLFPTPPNDPTRGTQTTGNLRLRLEPTLNISEQVRVLSQIDLLDGFPLGSSQTGPVQPPVDSPVTLDRPAIQVKRAWGEVQTPVGLLSFGRMPSQWGLGIYAHAGGGLDDDLGDSVDRLQLAVPLRGTFLGPSVIVPYYDLESSGLVSQNLEGVGQPISLSKADERWALGLKFVRIDTEEELARRLAAGSSSFNWGAYYGWHVQHYALTPTAASLPPGTPNQGVTVDTTVVGLSTHSLDLWWRWRSKKARLEMEAVGLVGSVADHVVRQWGGAFQGDYRPGEGKVLLGLEWGAASGDRNFGMGNHPERGVPVPGSIDGSQLEDGIRNYRFNPAYRVDMILWRELLGNVTDAWYLKPSMRYDVLEGLSLRFALVYSQALTASSTPSTAHKPLGIELDSAIHYASDDGFNFWVGWGFLHPLDGLDYPPGARLPTDHSLTNAHAIRTGLAVKF